MSAGLEVVRLLVSKFGANPLAVDADGWTLVHTAVRWANPSPEVILALVRDFGIDPERAANNKDTALTLACETGNFEAFNVLTKELGLSFADSTVLAKAGGTAVGGKKRSTTSIGAAVNAACKGVRLEMLKHLVANHKADVSALTNDRTPVYCASASLKTCSCQLGM
jgi:ankyrin repeat protein